MFQVEQFVICSPHDGESWKLMELMNSNAEKFYQALNIPYRIVGIVSGNVFFFTSKNVSDCINPYELARII